MKTKAQLFALTGETFSAVMAFRVMAFVFFKRNEILNKFFKKFKKNSTKKIFGSNYLSPQLKLKIICRQRKKAKLRKTFTMQNNAKRK